MRILHSLMTVAFLCIVTLQRGSSRPGVRYALSAGTSPARTASTTTTPKYIHSAGLVTSQSMPSPTIRRRKIEPPAPIRWPATMPSTPPIRPIRAASTQISARIFARVAPSARRIAISRLRARPSCRCSPGSPRPPRPSRAARSQQQQGARREEHVEELAHDRRRVDGGGLVAVVDRPHQRLRRTSCASSTRIAQIIHLSFGSFSSIVPSGSRKYDACSDACSWSWSSAACVVAGFVAG